MLGLLRSIVDTIAVLITFLGNTITSLVVLIIQIPEYLTIVIQSLNFLPPFILPFALAYVSLIVVQYVLNRKGQ